MTPKEPCICGSTFLPDLLKVPPDKVAWECPECKVTGPPASTQDRAAIAWDEKFKAAQGKHGRT